MNLPLATNSYSDAIVYCKWLIAHDDFLQVEWGAILKSDTNYSEDKMLLLL